MSYSNLEEHILSLESKVQEISAKIKESMSSIEVEEEKYNANQKHILSLAEKQAQNIPVPSMNIEIPKFSHVHITDELLWSCLDEIYKL